jgi:hypothetical protein
MCINRAAVRAPHGMVDGEILKGAYICFCVIIGNKYR